MDSQVPHCREKLISPQGEAETAESFRHLFISVFPNANFVAVVAETVPRTVETPRILSSGSTERGMSEGAALRSAIATSHGANSSAETPREISSWKAEIHHM